MQTRLAVISMREGDYKTAKDLLRSMRDEVDAMTNADVAVHSALSNAAMEYHRVISCFSCCFV